MDWVALNLMKPDSALYGIDQLPRVVSNAILKNNFDIFDIVDLCRGIAFDDHQVGLFADRN